MVTWSMEQKLKMKTQTFGLLRDSFLSLVPLVTVSVPVGKERGRKKNKKFSTDLTVMEIK